jgi:predicted CXXCH cytochrome family protein
MTLNIPCAPDKGGVQKRLSLSLFFLIWLLFFALFSETSWSASFLNAPHTEANGVYCIDCHEYPYDLWQGALPVNPTIDDTVKNFICLKCHSETGNAPQKAIHSSLIMAEQSHYPAWTTECVNCHDPHFQGQLAHFSTDSSELYLITGLIDSISANGTETIINYSAVTGKPGWLDPSKWNSKTGAGRGLIFVADALTPKDTFEIITADNFSITVSGLVNPSAPGSIFGIIYGQMIREQVLTAVGPKDVKFYDSEGGFTDTSPTSSPTGICQVCHTQTLYWTSSGNNSLHNINTNCTGCHAAAQGFRVSYHDHSLNVTASVGCISCHDHPDITGVYHFGNCITCHNSPKPEVIAAIASGSAECITCHGADFTTTHPDTIVHTSIITVGTTSCANCHNDSPPLVNVADPKVHNACLSCHDINGTLVSRAIGKSFAVGGDCATCHAEAFEMIHPNIIDHSTIVTTTGTSCGSCHTSTALIDAVDPKVHNDCSSCHDANGALISLAISKTAPGNCITCHTGDFTTTHPATVDHSLAVQNSISCADCHTSTALVDPIDPTVHNACASCHDTSGALIGSASTNLTPNECISCHTSGFLTIHPVTVDHSGIVTTTGTSCGSCHTSTTLIDAVDPKVHNDCSSCHDANGALISLAISKTAPGNCITCHTGDFTTTHPATVDHSLAVQNSIGCADCHTSTALVDPIDPTVHNACASCHDTSGSLIGSASGNLAPNECISCHTSAFNLLHTYTHFGINTTQSCGTTGCHDFPDVVVGIHQNNCNLCHDSTDPTVTGAVTAGQAECISCHTTGGHEMRYPYATCASCHLGKHDEWSWPPNSSGDKLHDKHINAKGITDCTSCHGNTSPTCGGCHKHSSIALGPGGSLHDKHANKGNISCSDCHTQGDKGP